MFGKIAQAIVACLVLVSIISPIAFAEKKPSPPAAKDSGNDPAMAKKLYAEGMKSFDDGDYETALLRFQTAKTFTFIPKMDWNIAICHMRLRQYASAIEAFRNYREGIDISDAKELATVEKYLKAAEAAQAARDAAPVAPEKKPPAVTPSSDDGMRVIGEGEWDGPPRKASPAAIPSPQIPAPTSPPTAVPAPAVPAAPEVVVPVVPAPETPAPDQPKPSVLRRYRWTLVGTGVTGALLVAGTSFMVKSGLDYNMYDQRCKPNCRPADVAGSQTLQRVGAGFLGVAGVTAAATLTLGLLERYGKIPLPIAIVPTDDGEGGEAVIGGSF